MEVKWINSNRSSCDNKRELVVYEKGSSWDWEFGTMDVGSNGKRLLNRLVHEFGHVVGLGHAHDVGECRSVMAYPGECTMPTEGGRHPLKWDKDCVPYDSYPYWDGSPLKYRYQTWDSSGNAEYNGTYTSWLDTGFVGGGGVRSSGNYRYFTTYDGKLPYSSHRRRTVAANSDGSIVLNSPYSISGSHADIIGLDEPPLVGRGHEFTHTVEPLRITFLDDENDSSPNTWYNPPYVQYMRTNHSFSGSPLTSDLTLYYCVGATCSYPVRSHVPVTSAWNAWDGGDTVTVRVATDSLEGGDGGGNIVVHPAYAASNQLKQGQMTSAIAHSLPSGPNGYDYLHETDFHSPVACASDWGSSYNCMVAWLDKGAFDGSILYAFFRVSSDSVQWTTPIRRFPYGWTAGAPALAYFDGAIHLAFVNHITHRLYVYRTTYPGSWSLLHVSYDSLLTGSPTFLADGDGVEAAVLWTQAAL